MKFEICGEIVTGRVHFVNGPGTSKEASVYYNTELEDEDGRFLGNKMIAIPIPSNSMLEIGNNEYFDGKKIKITIEIEE